jgi:hypothetical protein
VRIALKLLYIELNEGVAQKHILQHISESVYM